MIRIWIEVGIFDKGKGEMWLPTDFFSFASSCIHPCSNERLAAAEERWASQKKKNCPTIEWTKPNRDSTTSSILTGQRGILEAPQDHSTNLHIISCFRSRRNSRLDCNVENIGNRKGNAKEQQQFCSPLLQSRHETLLSRHEIFFRSRYIGRIRFRCIIQTRRVSIEYSVPKQTICSTLPHHFVGWSPMDRRRGRGSKRSRRYSRFLGWGWLC